MAMERLTKCKHCGKEGINGNEYVRFCPACGAPLVNECSSYECDRLLSLDDAFCKYCGEPSTFLNIGFVTAEKAFSASDESVHDPFGA